MAKQHYLVAGTRTPQSKPLPGMIANDAGGYTYPADKWTRLRRFLVTGTEGGTYYTSEQEETFRQIAALRECIAEDPNRVLAEICEVSTENLAAKNDYAIFALAFLMSEGDAQITNRAGKVLPAICRTGTHLFQFCMFVDALSGWGRGKRRAVASWYETKTPRDLAFQLVKYRQRDGWTHRDVLRLTHPKGASAAHKELYHYAVTGGGPDDIEYDGESGEMVLPRDFKIIEGFQRIQGVTNLKRAIEITKQYNLPREAVPTDFLTEPGIWEALFDTMPYIAMIRNLANMTRVGFLEPFAPSTVEVCQRIVDVEAIRRSRVHPMQILIAAYTYAAGRGLRGRNTWTVIPQIVDALNEAFYLAFQNVEPTNKRLLLGVDCSGSMGGGMVAGIPGFTPAMAAAAMALVTAHVEPNYLVVAFATDVKPLQFSRGMRLVDALKLTALGTGQGTDCAVPINLAIQSGLYIDGFITYTDGQTWAGHKAVPQALAEYRRKSGIQARMVNVDMVANNFGICDPADPLCLDVAGFDASTPRLISEFVAGRL